jgi:hypothetical protein
MPFDPAAHRASLIAHYLFLASQPAWKAYVRHRAEQLARDCPEMFADLPALLAAAMKR